MTEETAKPSQAKPNIKEFTPEEMANHKRQEGKRQLHGKETRPEE